MHRKMRCAARAAVEAEEVAQAAKVAEGLYLLPRRAYRHQMFGERHNRMCCEGWCPLAAVSTDHFCELLRRYFACAMSLHSTWASFSSRPKTLKIKRRQRQVQWKLVFVAAVSLPDTLPRRPHASNSCSTDHLAHSRLLGVIIPQAQEFAISGNVYRGLVGVLIRGPCLEQSASLQLCVWYTFCR